VINFTEKDGSLIFTVKVVPRASKSEVIGEMDGALKIRITSPPIDGAANAELIKLLSKNFGVSKSAVEIVSGETFKTKQIKVTVERGGEKLEAILQAKIRRGILPFSSNPKN
jgi:uncharacterized protein (TIGR00251 family)